MKSNDKTILEHGTWNNDNNNKLGYDIDIIVIVQCMFCTSSACRFLADRYGQGDTPCLYGRAGSLAVRTSQYMFEVIGGGVVG